MIAALRPRPRRRVRAGGRAVRPPLRRAAAVLSFAALGLSACASVPSEPVGDDGVPRSTTRIAGAPVLGVEEDPVAVCGPQAPLDPDASPAVDARRIVAVGSAALDTLCALGLQNRVVATAPAAGAAPLRYLGPWVQRPTDAGTAAAPDAAAIRAAAPDLVLIDESADAGAFGGTTARTVTVPTAGPWPTTVRTVADAVGRGGAAQAMISAFTGTAATTGHDIAASQTQASVARFTADGTQIQGAGSFAGQVLAQIGVPRPPAQRFASPSVRTVDEDDLAPIEGDVLFLSYAGKDSGDADAGGDTAAVRHGREVMGSGAWTALAVAKDRTFTVDDGVWARGRGLVAARQILDDVRGSLNAYG